MAVRSISLVLATLVVAAAARAQDRAWTPQAGASLRVSTRDRTAFIIDGGRTGALNEPRAPGRRALEELVQRGVRRLVVTCTHEHLDHAEGLVEALTEGAFPAFAELHVVDGGVKGARRLDRAFAEAHPDLEGTVKLVRYGPLEGEVPAAAEDAVAIVNEFDEPDALWELETLLARRLAERVAAARSFEERGAPAPDALVAKRDALEELRSSCETLRVALSGAASEEESELEEVRGRLRAVLRRRSEIAPQGQEQAIDPDALARLDAEVAALTDRRAELMRNATERGANPHARAANERTRARKALEETSRELREAERSRRLVEASIEEARRRATSKRRVIIAMDGSEGEKLKATIVGRRAEDGR